MTPPRIQGIVFDLDGTIVDSLAVTFEAFNHGIGLHGGRHLAPHEIMGYFGPGENEIFGRILGRQNADSAYRAARDYLDQNLDKVPLHDGIPELLSELADRKVPIAIFTGRSWNTTEVILRHHGLLDRFITVVANDHVSSPKPSPEGLLLALKRMGLRPEEALLVGDSPVDVRAAKHAGSIAVGALWDRFAEREELERQKADHLVQNPLDLLDLYDQLAVRT